MRSFANASRVGRGTLGYSRQAGERKGPGGLLGLQHRCGTVRTVSGGFDSHALPPSAQSVDDRRGELLRAGAAALVDGQALAGGVGRLDRLLQLRALLA